MIYNSVLSTQLQGDKLKVLSRYLATSNFNTSGRAYLDDFKPFSDVFKPKSLSMQAAKALIIPANSIVMEFNKYEVECSENPKRILPEFDWQGRIEHYLPSFYHNTVRNLSISWLRKLFEEIALHNYTAQAVDKLTKDVQKSLVRKWERYGRFGASYRIIKTNFYSGLLFNTTSFLVDVLFAGAYHLHDYWTQPAAQETPENKKKTKTLVTTIKTLFHPYYASYYIANKAIFYTLLNVISPLGYGVGALVNRDYGGGMIGATLLEIGFMIAFNVVMPL